MVWENFFGVKWGFLRAWGFPTVQEWGELCAGQGQAHHFPSLNTNSWGGSVPAGGGVAMYEWVQPWSYKGRGRHLLCVATVGDFHLGQPPLCHKWGMETQRREVSTLVRSWGLEACLQYLDAHLRQPWASTCEPSWHQINYNPISDGIANCQYLSAQYLSPEAFKCCKSTPPPSPSSLSGPVPLPS